MFGNKSLPSKIYSYPCMPPSVGAEAASEQIRLAHRYRNKLVEVELERRKSAEEVLRKHYPNMKTLDDEILRIQTSIEIVMEEIKKRNKQEKRKSATKEEKDDLKNLRRSLKEVRAMLKEMRTTAWADEGLKADLAIVEEEAAKRHKAARQASGVAWGSYLAVDQAAQAFRRGRPPRLRRFYGRGKISVQIQKGMSVEEVMIGKDVRLSVKMVPLFARPKFNKKGKPLPAADPNSKRSQRGRDALCRIRLRSVPDSLFVEVPFVMTRPLPDGARVKWVYLCRRHIGTHERWKLQFVVEKEGGWPMEDAADSGVVAVNIGWRKLQDGLRVAFWVGDDGSRGELVIPWRDVGRWEKSDDLHSIRDRMFNEVKPILSSWLKENESILPDWLKERCESLSHWRGQARLASVVMFWNGNRFEGDEEIFDHLEAWRKQEKHLYDWESFGRYKAVGWRDDFYRVFAKKMRRIYRTVVMGKTDYKVMARLPGPEEKSGPQTGGSRQVAAPGRLQSLIKEGFAEHLFVDAYDITKECNSCGLVNDFDAAVSVTHTCQGCGKSYDIDENACLVLLKRYTNSKESC